MENNKKRRHGPVPKPDAEKRSHCVSVRFSADELQHLDSIRRSYRRGHFLRLAAFNKLPVSIPEVNAKFHSELGRVGSNLNQLARSINSGLATGIDARSLAELHELLTEVRAALIGVGEDE